MVCERPSCRLIPEKSQAQARKLAALWPPAHLAIELRWAGNFDTRDNCVLGTCRFPLRYHAVTTYGGCHGFRSRRTALDAGNSASDHSDSCIVHAPLTSASELRSPRSSDCPGTRRSGIHSVDRRPRRRIHLTLMHPQAHCRQAYSPSSFAIRIAVQLIDALSGRRHC